MNYDTVQKVLNNPNLWQKYFQDVIQTTNVIFWWLNGKPVDTGAGLKPTAKKFIKQMDGGSRFEIPLMLYTNTNLKSYAKDDSFQLTANNIGDRAYYEIKSLGGPIPIYKYDIDVSGSSKTNLIDCMKSYIRQAELTVANLADAMLNTAEGAEGPNDWTSLYTPIAAGSDAAGSGSTKSGDTIGGVSSTTFAKWGNQTFTSSGSMATYLKKDVAKMRRQATIGIQRPKLMYTSANIYGALYDLLVSNQRYVPDVELVKAGFEGMEYDGMSCMFSGNAIEGTILLINPEGLIYGTLKGAEMKIDPFIDVPGKDMLTSFLTHRGNLCVADRRTSVNGKSFTTA